MHSMPLGKSARRALRPLAACSFLLLLASTAPGSALAEPSPAEQLNAAFARLFDYPSVRSVELRILRNGRVAGQREFDFARRLIDGRSHTILQFTGPSYLRDNSILMIEDERGVSQTWLFQPEVGAPRRVSTYQKEDSFFGSDLSYADLETRNWSGHEVKALPPEEDAGGGLETHRFDRFEAIPDASSPYARHVVWLDRASGAVARLESFRVGATAPTKVLEVELDSLEGSGDALIPRKMTVTRRDKAWVTEVAFTRVELKPDLTESTFSAMRLQRGRGGDLFKLVDRLARKEARAPRRLAGSGGAQ